MRSELMPLSRATSRDLPTNKRTHAQRRVLGDVPDHQHQHERVEELDRDDPHPVAVRPVGQRRRHAGDRVRVGHQQQEAVEQRAGAERHDERLGLQLDDEEPVDESARGPDRDRCRAAGTIGQSCWAFSTAIVIAPSAPEKPSDRSRSPTIAGSSAARARMNNADCVPSTLPRLFVVGNRSDALIENSDDQHDPRQRQGQLLAVPRRSTTRS